MNEKDKFLTAHKKISEAKEILVLLPPSPSEDMVNGALCLYLSLLESDKKSQIGCSSEIASNPNILETDRIKDSVGSRNLSISFDYNEEYLDKVDYDVRSDGKFYLIVKPKENSPIPDISGVKFAYTGARADLVITFGIFSLEELGKIYADEKNFLDNADILSINTSPRPASFSCESLHTLYNSYAELVSEFLEKSSFKVSEIAAKNLLYGIYQNTHNLTSAKVTAETFSSVAYLMRSGGQIPSQKRSISGLAHAPFFEIPTQHNLPSQETPDEAPIPQDWKKPKIFRADEDR